jgi:riboflavin synthase alpha subunit
VSTKVASDVQVGDRISIRGVELTVTRIDHPFLGMPNMVKFVESTDQVWRCVPTTTDSEVEVS